MCQHSRIGIRTVERFDALVKEAAEECVHLRRRIALESAEHARAHALGILGQVQLVGQAPAADAEQLPQRQASAAPQRVHQLLGRRAVDAGAIEIECSDGDLTGRIAMQMLKPGRHQALGRQRFLTDAHHASRQQSRLVADRRAFRRLHPVHVGHLAALSKHLHPPPRRSLRTENYTTPHRSRLLRAADRACPAPRYRHDA